MKFSKKAVSVLLAAAMLVSVLAVSFTVNASTGTLASNYYATNPDGKVGVQKTITIDGSASDWDESMLIAQGAAWDVANQYKGGHENCVLDTYALFACWDSSNLYVGWQMVNTTDTWAREGDGPLSDGGRVLDVPLILALDVDPTSVSMSNKNTSGNSIWGQKMGVTFEQHVDHLLYMSGKPGLGTPAMFTAVDAQGNTDYNSGCKIFSSNGISYKMAETNICSHIYGLNGSKSTSDVYSNTAGWVDYKTYKGSSGTHKTSYDSFYEIKIPLSTLGIDASYIQNYGIGAMLIATRGESGLDCIPYDDTMLDNATGSYSSDPSTSKEKEDEDVITSEFARIGANGGDTPVVQPTTSSSSEQGSTLTVNSTSNYFPSKSYTTASGDKYVTVTYNLKSSAPILNSQWQLTYDISKLKFNSAAMPNVDGFACEENTSGIVKGNSTSLSFSSFSTEKEFISVTFKVLGEGSTNVNLDLQYLGARYNNTNVYPVDNSTAQTISGVTVTKSTEINANNVMLGDVSGDGVITVADATLVQKHAAEMITLTGDAALAADTSKDGVITVADATLIQKFAAEMIDSFD